jgi:hypothetical protein
MDRIGDRPGQGQIAGAQLLTTRPVEANHLTKHEIGTAADDPKAAEVRDPKWQKTLVEIPNGGVAANWFSEIARECAPGPQGRLNRPPSSLSPGVGRRRRPIDGQ